jgi:hypothetical protein
VSFAYLLGSLRLSGLLRNAPQSLLAHDETRLEHHSLHSAIPPSDILDYCFENIVIHRLTISPGQVTGIKA